jgi:hypothetical protein
MSAGLNGAYRPKRDPAMHRAFIAWSALLDQPAMDDAAGFLRDAMPAALPLQQSREAIRAIRPQQHREGRVRYKSP